jgi:hypothetical protein
MIGRDVAIATAAARGMPMINARSCFIIGLPFYSVSCPSNNQYIQAACRRRVEKPCQGN